MRQCKYSVKVMRRSADMGWSVAKQAGMIYFPKHKERNVAMMKRLRYAMVGGSKGSFIGPVHRMAIRMDNLADLVAGAFSRDPKKNAETAAELGLAAEHVHPDWTSLLAAEKDNIDFLAVCTPNDSHYEIARAALEAGLDVMCEKPLSMTVAEAEELGRLARRKRRILGIPFSYSGMPMVKFARELVAQGEIGKVCKIVLEYNQGSFRKIDLTKPLDVRNAWKMDPRRSGPSCAVADIGVHAFHMLEYVTGLEVKEVLADLSSFAPGNRLEDDASILLRFKGGAKALLNVSKVATGEENGLRLRVYGEKASLYWNQEENDYLVLKSPFEPHRTYSRKAPYMKTASASFARTSRIPAGHHEGFMEAFANIYDEFCAAVKTREPRDFPGAHEGVRTMRFVEAVLASHKAGGAWTKV